MIKTRRPSRSISPASSVDSTRKHRSSSNKRKSSKQQPKSKEDVQVFTSLPPKVEGEIRFFLKLQITKINLITTNEQEKTKHQPKAIKKDITSSKLTNQQILARCIWWGEESSGSLFRPKTQSVSTVMINNDAKKEVSKALTQTNAKYVVRSSAKQFSAYLNDMKSLEIDLLNELTMDVIGKVQLYEIGQLSDKNPIKGFFPAFDAFQNKVADVYLSIKLELPNEIIDISNSRKQSDQSLLSDQSRPITPNSMANINDFYSKYSKFEQQQQQIANFNLASSMAHNNKFNSDSYAQATQYESIYNYNNEDLVNIKKPIIETLIEKGNKLKSEMIQSTATFTKSSSHFLTKNILDEKFNNTSFGNSFADPTSFLLDNSSNGFYDNLNLNDVSRLSDPLHDPELLSALLYDNKNSNSFLENSMNKRKEFVDQNDEDEELRKLLNPSHLMSLNQIQHEEDFEPIKLKNIQNHVNNKASINFTNQFPSKSLVNRPRSISRSSISSNDDDLSPTKLNPNRVSFEMQSSDCESHHSFSQEKCLDVLGKDRISLLNLVQIAKLKIDKMCLFNLNNVSNILERISNIENYIQYQSQANKHSNKFQSIGNSASSKPPKAIKKQDLNQLFFIEYQFPVIANSRDNLTHQHLNQSAATQIMRATSKNIRKQDENGTLSSEEVVIYDHMADYSILFNTSLLESWWRSTIVFKLYCRSQSAGLGGKVGATSPPFLFGIARLDLRNLLKSRNFKLYKKLAIYDQLSEVERNLGNAASLNNSINFNRRIGTLHVKIELLSDLKEFNINLIKLNKMKDKSINRKLTNVISKPLKLNEQKSEQPIKQATKTPTISKNNNQLIQIQNLKNLNEEEFAIPIQMFLSINDGKGFSSLMNRKLNSSIYLICRLFWTKEKVKFETEPTTTNGALFCWSLNLSFMLKKSLIENMKNNYMILEAWEKKSDKNQTDALIGTIKLPLHEFYMKFSDETFLSDFVTKQNNDFQPVIGVDGWISALDPFTGHKAGEINVLLAMGSNEQIVNLSKILFDKEKLKLPSSVHNQLIQSDSNELSKLIEHIFTFKIDSIKIHPKISTQRDDTTFDETNCFIKYIFPTTLISNKESETKFIFNTYSIASIANVNFYNKIEHRLLLKKVTSLYDELIKRFAEYYYKKDVSSLTNKEDCFILFEVWSTSHYPNLREKLIARGDLTIDKLITLVNNSTINLNNRSFIIPLITSSSSNQHNDKFIGQLNLTVEYKLENINYNFNQLPQIEFSSDVNNSTNYVCMNVGILRATGLQMAITNSICKNNSRSFNIDKSKVYVKFSLSFLNKPNEIKQTKAISTSLNGFSPEFFDYFDLPCNIKSTYNTSEKRTISLAEQLEVGQIIFEVWSKFNDYDSQTQNNGSDLLLGTCIVPLEALLENRIGIRGWLPIKPVNLSSEIQQLDQAIGGLEIAVRFMKTDDFLRVIAAGKEVGWIRERDLKFLNKNSSYHQSRNLVESFNKPKSNRTSPVRNTSTQKSDGIKCLIEIEKAVHLPTIYDENLNVHNPPNSFVSFNISLNGEASDQIAQTNICEKKISPTWNYQLVAHIDSDYFLNETKPFIMNVWHSGTRFDSSAVGNKGSKLLGYASIDITPLLCGLTHISGWYNIQDKVGNCHGQLKINILPQENLFALKELYLTRKKTSLQANNKMNENISNTNSSLYRFNELLAQSASTMSLGNTTNRSMFNNEYKIPSLSSLSQPTSTTTPRSDASYNQNLNNNIDKNNNSNKSSDLKLGLFQKLNELDELNRILKERLEKNSNRNRNNFSKGNTIMTNLLSKTNDPNLHYNENILAESSSTSQTQKNIIRNEEVQIVQNNEKMNENIAVEELNVNYQKLNLIANINNHQYQMSELVEEVDHEAINKANQSVTDSFWINSDGFERHSELQHNNHKSNNLSTIQSINNNEIVHKLMENETPQQNQHEVNNAEENLNDTEYDQTFNLNVSYEILPNNNSDTTNDVLKTNEEKISPEYESDFEEEKIIDCSKLENNNVSLFIHNNEDINDDIEDANDINNYNQDYFEDEQNENLTVIVPEELNKIEENNENKNDEVEEIQMEENLNVEEITPKLTILSENKLNTNEINLSEKFKNIHSKIPNYFLPQEDMEKNMRKLHYNYSQITKVDKTSQELIDEEIENNQQNEEDIKSKPKSTEILNKNKNTLQQDFNRINKIFHTKFN